MGNVRIQRLITDVVLVALFLYAGNSLCVFGLRKEIGRVGVYFSMVLEQAKERVGRYPSTAEDAASRMMAVVRGKPRYSVSYEADTGRTRFTAFGDTVSASYYLPEDSDMPRVEFRAIRSLPGNVRHYIESSPTLLLVLAALPVAYVIWGRRRLFRAYRPQT